MGGVTLAEQNDAGVLEALLPFMLYALLSSFISSYRYLLSSVLSVYSSLPLPRPLCRSLENGCCRVSSAQNVWCGFCSLLFYLISAFGPPSRLRAQASIFSPSGT